jgi:hypothetical protein
MQMVASRRTLYCLLVFCTLNFSASTAESLYVKKQQETIRVRLVAREAPIQASAFSQNVDSYVVEVVDSNGNQHLGRLSFRFLPYESPIPEELRDYAMVHTFRAMRDRNCDTSAAQLSARPLQYSSAAPEFKIKSAAALPCYVVTSKDYKGSKRDRVARKESKGKKDNGKGLLARRD